MTATLGQPVTAANTHVSCLGLGHNWGLQPTALSALVQKVKVHRARIPPNFQHVAPVFLSPKSGFCKLWDVMGLGLEF